jgi:hypothetical protein
MMFYVKMYWCFIVFYHGLVFVNNAADLKIQKIEDFKFDSMGITLLILSSLTLDLTSSNKFFEDRENLKKESEIKREYAAYCTAYDFNERKVY